MGAIIQQLLFKNNSEPVKKEVQPIMEIKVKDIDGFETTIKGLMEGHKLALIVNVASK